MRAVQQGQPIGCDRFHDAVEQVAFKLELKLDNLDHRSFLLQTEAALQANLVADALPNHVGGGWRQRFRFKGGSLEWDQRLGPATRVFGDLLGGYRLFIGLGDQVIATKAFQVISLKECQETARDLLRQNANLVEASLSAVNHRKVTEPLQVVAEDYHSIDIRLMLDAPQPDCLLPEIDLPLAAALQRGKQELHRQQRDITLRRGRQRAQESVSLKPEFFASGPGRYYIGVWLGDRLLKEVGFRHKTHAQLKQEKAEALLRSLSLSEPRLFTVRDGERVQTDHVFATDRAVAPTFCIEGRGFDDNAPGLQWQLRLKLVNLDSGHTIEHARALQERDGKNMHANVELPLRTPSRDLGPGRYTLQLCKRAEVLTEFRFRILAIDEIAPYTEKMVLQSLRADGAQLFIQAGATRYQCCQVPDTSDLLLAATLRAFPPSIAITVQRHPFDPEAATALLEFRRPVPGAHCAQIWERRPGRRQPVQDSLDFFSEPNESRFAGFLPLVADHLVLPVNVPGFEKRNVGLRRADVPRQFVKRTPFGIGLPDHNRPVFCQRDRSLLLE